MLSRRLILGFPLTRSLPRRRRVTSVAAKFPSTRRRQGVSRVCFGLVAPGPTLTTKSGERAVEQSTERSRRLVRWTVAERIPAGAHIASRGVGSAYDDWQLIGLPSIWSLRQDPS